MKPADNSRRTRIKEGRAKRNRRRFYTPDGRARASHKWNKPEHTAKAGCVPGLLDQ